MRFLILAVLAIAACDACTKTPKPKAEYSSKKCELMKCDSCGMCECTDEK